MHKLINVLAQKFLFRSPSAYVLRTRYKKGPIKRDGIRGEITARFYRVARAALKRDPEQPTLIYNSMPLSAGRIEGGNIVIPRNVHRTSVQLWPCARNWCQYFYYDGTNQDKLHHQLPKHQFRGSPNFKAPLEIWFCLFSPLILLSLLPHESARLPLSLKRKWH